MTSCWYLPQLASDKGSQSSFDIESAAKLCEKVAFRHSYDKQELLSATMYEWMLGSDEVPPKVRMSRAVSKAAYSLKRLDYVAHNAREKKSLGEEYNRWTPRITQVLIEHLSDHRA